MRVVIAHDFMETYAGAERVTQELALAFPNAPVYALLGRRDVAERMGVADRFHSVVGSRARLLRRYRELAPIWPLVVDATPLPPADVLVSSSYAFAHRFRTANRAVHVSYCHSPLRFAWSMTGAYREQWASGPLEAVAFDALAAAMRRGDRRAAERVDRYLTQSPFVARQIRGCYGREARVIGAPVDCDLFRPSSTGPGDYFVACSRLVEPYKQISVAVEAFRGLDARLVVVGDGPARRQLEDAAPPNVEFVGQLGDDDLVAVIQRCRALVFPSTDDFGLVPVEVMACGRPVLAYADGGVLHTVVPGVTGSFFTERTASALRAALTEFDPTAWDSAAIRDHALQWSRDRFHERVREEVRLAVDARGGADGTRPDRRPGTRPVVPWPPRPGARGRTPLAVGRRG